MVLRLIFQDGVGGYFGFCPLEKNAGICQRDREANFFKKRSIEVKQNRQTILASHGIEVYDPTIMKNVCDNTVI